MSTLSMAGLARLAIMAMAHNVAASEMTLECFIESLRIEPVSENPSSTEADDSSIHSDMRPVRYLECRLAAAVAANIVGYSRLIGRGEGRIAPSVSSLRVVKAGLLQLGHRADSTRDEDRTRD